MTTPRPFSPEPQALTVEDSLGQISFRHLVRLGFDWMEVTCAPYQAGTPEQPRIAMGLTITSSFGAFGFNYYSIGIPEEADASPEVAARIFLSEIEQDSLLNKLVEDKPEVLDFEATKSHLQKVCTEVIDEAENRPLEKAQLVAARVRLEELFEEVEHSHEPAVQAHLLYESSAFHEICGDDAWEDLRFQTGGRRMREAEGMFEKLWRPYQEHLRGTLPERVR